MLISIAKYGLLISVILAFPFTTIHSQSVSSIPLATQQKTSQLLQGVLNPKPVPDMGQVAESLQAQNEAYNHKLDADLAAKQAALEALQATIAPQVVQSTAPKPIARPTASTNVTEALTYGQSLVSQAQWPCLYNLWERESGWNSYAVNPYSGAAGIAQSLGHGYVQLGDYIGQINWGLSYINSRYGSPCNAWSAELNQGWY